MEDSAQLLCSAASSKDEPLKKKQKLDEKQDFGMVEKDENTSESLHTKNTLKNPTKSNVMEDISDASVIKCHRSEGDVGILEYVSTHHGFSGILKQRYSDFVVNEIDVDGNTVHLTNTDLPEVFLKEELENAVLLPETLQKLEQLKNNEDKTVKVVVATEEDKYQRTLIHREIRQKFPMLESDTVNEDGHTIVRAFHTNQADNKRRRKNDWPKDRGVYCHFVLYKENKDTMQAINLLAKLLKIKPDRFSYAGTKDGRAVTVQRVSVFRIDARNLQGLNKVLKKLCVGNFEFKKTPLKLGDLKGNFFVIVLRNIDGTKEQVQAAMCSLKNIGFINYFGLQRFGTSANATHAIGLCLLKSQWSEAVDLILGSRCDQDDVLSKAYEHWKKTKNAKECLKLLEGKKCLEAILLEGLSKFDENKDFVAALKVLPRNTRLMYVHAYQSYIWNVVVSKRFKECGLKPVIGDLVFDKIRKSQPELDANTVKILTCEDLALYTIHDVVLPLPGYDVTYPQHIARHWYEELLSHDGLDINNMRHNVKDYALSGAYRHMIVQPDNMTWEMFRYNDPTISLVRTDMDRMSGLSEPGSTNDGKYRALRLEFSLPASSYATMVVRDILKTDTSSSFHASLNPQ